MVPRRCTSIARATYMQDLNDLPSCSHFRKLLITGCSRRLRYKLTIDLHTRYRLGRRAALVIVRNLFANLVLGVGKHSVRLQVSDGIGASGGDGLEVSLDGRREVGHPLRDSGLLDRRIGRCFGLSGRDAVCGSGRMSRSCRGSLRLLRLRLKNGLLPC